MNFLSVLCIGIILYMNSVCDKSSITVPILRLKFKVCFAHTLLISFSLVPTGFVK